MLPRLSVVALIVLTGCARQPARVGLGLPAPNPNGCYVLVYEQPDLRGAGVVLNGPGRWPSLERLPTNQENWRNRIRSISVGSAASVTVYADASFTGVSARFGPETKHARLDNSLVAQIESLVLTCQP